MKSVIQKISLIIAVILYGSYGWSQIQYTAYDDLPGVIKSYKPSYHNSLPVWAKRLYQFPVNFNELQGEYEAYMKEHKGEKSAMIRYYKIWSQAVVPYVQSDGAILMPDIEEYRSRLLESQLNYKKRSVSTKSATGSWTFLGPKNTYWLGDGSQTVPLAYPWQVNVYSFDVAASDNNTIYCGTESGIVNKTIDNGLNWEQKGLDYVFGGGILAVAINPADHDTVYVSAGWQIHKTTDGGETWAPQLGINNNSNFAANRLKIDPTNHKKIFASAPQGVYVTTDEGVHWSCSLLKATYDVEIKPDDSNTIFAISNNVGMAEVYKSNDEGESFQATSFPDDVPYRSGAMLAVTPANPNTVYAVVLSEDPEIEDHKLSAVPYIYKGTYDPVSESFSSWIKIAVGKTDYLKMDNGQGYFDLVLEVSPEDENMVFVGTTTMYKSTDGGVHYDYVGGYHGDFRIHPDIQDLKLLPGGKIWVSTDGGMILSEDNFTNTSNYYCRNNGIVGSTFWGFDQGWNEDIIVGGRYHNGNTAMADFYGDKALRMGGAENPTGWVIHGKSRHVAFADLGPKGYILPKKAEDKVEGNFPFAKFPNMDGYGGKRGAILHHPNYYNVIYVGAGNGFWASSDMGKSFDLLHTFPGRVRYMEISFSNPNIIYADIVAGTYNDEGRFSETQYAGFGLFRSQDGGETWEWKTSLTDGTDYGNSEWNGSLSIAVSPTNGNVVYACRSNTPISWDEGKVFKSVNGGDSWTDYTGTLSGYFEGLVIQPDTQGKDLLYLFTHSSRTESAEVYYRANGMTDWEDFSNAYPAGVGVNHAKAFFRDSKIRSAGTAGVWESPLAEPNFKPLINPWVGNAVYNCEDEDTICFDDHSILNHQGASWHWSISPEPEYISNPDIRNPKVVLGTEGSYTVNLSVTKDGNTYSRTMPNMVTKTSCPSVNNCNNPGQILQDNWKLVYADSEEQDYKDLGAAHVFDGDINTIWHTQWYLADPTHPHEIQIDLDTLYNISELGFTMRQDIQNGRIKDYELYLSLDTDDWGDPVMTGVFENSVSPQIINLDEPVTARYLRLVALSAHDGNEHTTLAEVSLRGCYWADTTNILKRVEDQEISAFPVPANSIININLPHSGDYSYMVYSVSGRLMEKAGPAWSNGNFSLDLSKYGPGLYMVKLQDERGTIYRVRFIKE